MVVRAGDAEFVLDEAALVALFKSPNGPVAKHLARVGGQIEGEAKQLLSGDLVDVDTGRLRSSTTWKLFTQGDVIGLAVGSGADYSRHVHEGTRFMVGRPYLVIAARRVLGPSVI